jgi:hypothetical protein
MGHCCHPEDDAQDARAEPRHVHVIFRSCCRLTELHIATGLPPWRASVKGKAKTKEELKADALAAACDHMRTHAWPPAVLLALSSGQDDALFDDAALEQGDDECGYESGGEEEECEVEAPSAQGASADAAQALGSQLMRWLSTNGFHTATRAAALQAGHFWQSDHINPVAEGGGSCGLDNLRTLCTPCHAVETARLAARLAETRRNAAGSSRGGEAPAPPRKKKRKSNAKT